MKCYLTLIFKGVYNIKCYGSIIVRLISYYLGQIEEAIKFFDKPILLNPNDPKYNSF